MDSCQISHGKQECKEQGHQNASRVSKNQWQAVLDMFTKMDELENDFVFE
jgi:hypothetical protein